MLIKRIHEVTKQKDLFKLELVKARKLQVKMVKTNALTKDDNRNMQRLLGIETDAEDLKQKRINQIADRDLAQR